MKKTDKTNHAKPEGNGGTKVSELEASKVRSETQLNRAEATLKRLEARQLQSKPRWIDLSVPGATVIVAVVGFLGSFLATYIKGWSDIELMRQKYDSDLVLKAVAADSAQSRENLKFLLEAGLIKDADGRVAKAVADKNLSIRIASQVGADFQTDLSSEQMRKIVDEIEKVMQIDLDIRIYKINEAGFNAFAVASESGFELRYTKDFVDSLRRSTRTNWSTYAIVAHEIGHMALGHFHATNGPERDSRLKKELAADRWSGVAIAKLGGTLVEALAVYQAFPETAGTNSNPFPTREQRLAAVEEGWRSATPQHQ
jgi:hypothetical protein